MPACPENHVLCFRIGMQRKRGSSVLLELLSDDKVGGGVWESEGTQAGQEGNSTESQGLGSFSLSPPSPG